ncbi:MAG: c-type cytochrome [Proteobacteria bacterium]|nr:c-type cytochrome [Pseudomonadota bacterium]
MKYLIGALGWAALAAYALPAFAASVGDKDAGRSIALQICSACHKVTAIQAKPRNDLGAPPFIQYARRPSTTEFQIRRFFQTPHQRMPNFQFTPEETDNLVAYILSLK